MKTINLKSYNIWGQQINEGNIFIDIENEMLITKNGKKFKVVKDYIFTYNNSFITNPMSILYIILLLLLKLLNRFKLSFYSSL
jgi:hypothetical protein